MTKDPPELLTDEEIRDRLSGLRTQMKLDCGVISPEEADEEDKEDEDQGASKE